MYVQSRLGAPGVNGLAWLLLQNSLSFDTGLLCCDLNVVELEVEADDDHDGVVNEDQVQHHYQYKYAFLIRDHMSQLK